MLTKFRLVLRQNQEDAVPFVTSLRVDIQNYSVGTLWKKN